MDADAFAGGEQFQETKIYFVDRGVMMTVDRGVMRIGGSGQVWTAGSMERN
jgi:hypothetical protein